MEESSAEIPHGIIRLPTVSLNKPGRDPTVLAMRPMAKMAIRILILAIGVAGNAHS
ncbi:MAG TPA: hypothetical protein VE378_04575 [Nitrososphaeraceae archaeon]|nr:hypothetical protein [Nitrososphaeraceae archaeon]